MGSSLSGEEEPEQKEGQQDSAAASADCAQSSCPSAVGGDGKALAETVDVVSVVPTVDTSDSKALQPGTVETPSDTPVPAEPEEEAAPDSQVAPDRSNTRARSPRSPRSPLPLDSEHVRPQRELSPESEVADFDGQVPGQLHGSDQVKAQRTLEQQMSLKPGDDERTEISKKISWILRHGAKKVNVNIDEFGWVNVNDLLSSEILGGTTEDKLLAMINESNVQKTRYEMEDDPNGGKRVRAISKSRRNLYARELREKERREREKKRDEEVKDRELREREVRDADVVIPPDTDQWASREVRRRDDGRGWWDKAEEGWQDGPTYEQQIRDGFLPVWQGSRLVAMAKEHQTVRPGRRAAYLGGKGFDHVKGHENGKGLGESKGDKDGKGYEFRGDAKGERKGRGKDDHFQKGKDGKGKYGEDGKGFHGKGDGFKHDNFRHETKEEEHTVEAGKGDRDRFSRGSRQQRWRAVQDRDIIVRVGLGMETDIVGTLLAGSLVAQVGEDKILGNGIARMFVESIEPISGIKGWVTRSAEAAGGPIFFKPDRGSSSYAREPKGKEGKAGKGSQFGGEKGEKGKNDAKGKGRRPVGEGDAATGGRVNHADEQSPLPAAGTVETS